MAVFAPILDHDELLSLVVPVAATRGSTPLSILGTAFVVAPGWAITATHVVAEYHAAIDGRNLHVPTGLPSHYDLDPSFELRLALSAPNGMMDVVGARRHVFSSRGDICLIEMDERGYDWRRFGKFPILELAPPPIGSEVHVFGLPSTRSTPGDKSPVKLRLNPSRGSGRVTEVHPSGRDRALLNFSCFRTNAPILGGMSGGPVLNDRGHICGVASSSHTLQDGEEPISYAAALWPAVSLPLRSHPKVLGDYQRFFDLLSSGTIACCDMHRVQLSDRSAGSPSVTFNQR
jgi:hypothetical protein